MNIIKKDGFNFAFNPIGCESCEGNCCIGESGNIWIKKEEMKKLSKFLNISLEELKTNF